jgi:ferric-dicitrate binding protein FerR (iron transport regulator)
MDENIVRFPHEVTDEEYRTAAYWWIRLKECESDSPMLREFANWLADSANNQRAFAQVEAVWERIQRALSEHPSAHPRGEDSTLRSVS